MVLEGRCSVFRSVSRYSQQQETPLGILHMRMTLPTMMMISIVRVGGGRGVSARKQEQSQ